MLFEVGINILSMVVREVEIGCKRSTVERFPLCIALHLPAVLTQVVSVGAVAYIVLRIDQRTDAVMIVSERVCWRVLTRWALPKSTRVGVLTTAGLR